MADIYFQCACQKNLAVDESGAGSTVTCPDCGKPITIPQPEIKWIHLACGSDMAAPKSMAGQIIQCLTCKANTLVPSQKPAPPPKKQAFSKQLLSWGRPPSDKKPDTSG